MPTARIDATLDMNYYDDCFTDPWATPEAVVLHHGNVKNGKLWYRWVPLLAGQYRVIRLDARGFGRSTVPPPGYPWSVSGFARDVIGLLDALGLKKVHFIGESLGGVVGMQLAYEHPERLRSLTVIASPHRFAGYPTFAHGRDLVRTQGVEAYVRNSLSGRLDMSKASQAQIDWNLKELLGTPRHVLAETLDYLSGLDLTPILPKIRVPTLAMGGEATGRSGPIQMEELHKLIPGSRLTWIRGVAGMVQYTGVEQCMAAWRDFVAGLPKST